MEDYRKLTQKEADEIDNVGCQRQMDSVLSQYYCQVYRHRQYDEDEIYYTYYLADCKYSTLVKELFPNVDVSLFANGIGYHLERVV